MRLNPLVAWTVGLVTAIFVTAVGTRNFVLARVSFGADFFTFWTAARAMFVEGMNPYSLTVTRRSQMGIYGRPATPKEDQVAFVYPPYALLPLAPLAPMSFDWAMAFWLSAHLWLLLAAGLITMRDPPPLALAVLPLLYPVARNLVLGQLALTVVLVLLLAREGIRSQHKGAIVVGGMLLAWATIKVPLSWALVLLLLAGAIKRRAGLEAGGGFVAGLILLWGMSTWWVPRWPVQWWHQVRGYVDYVSAKPLFFLILDLLAPPWGYAVALLLGGVSGGGALYALVRWWKGAGSEVAALTWGSVLTFWLHPTLSVADTVVVLVPLLAWWEEARGKRAFWGAWAAFWLLPWVAFVILFRGAEPPAIALVMAGLTVGLGIWLLYCRVRRGTSGD